MPARAAAALERRGVAGVVDRQDEGGHAGGGWHRDLGRVIAALDVPELPLLLDAALKRVAPFDLSIIVAYPHEALPILLHDGIRGHEPGEALTAYLNGTYLLDPFYTACSRRVAPGLYRMRELAPDAFFEGDYVQSWEVHPCISMESGSLAEEIGYLVPLAGGFMASYSLMRRNGNPPFSGAELARLRRVEPVVREVVVRHWRGLPAPRPSASRPEARDEGERLERAFELFGAGVLSPREQMVVQLILRGHSTLSIAQTLRIAEGTVKNHRKSIHTKLAISSQRELFVRFVRHVLG
jgi:DNA-binding CsgD family transcriptional regulator